MNNNYFQPLHLNLTNMLMYKLLSNDRMLRINNPYYIREATLEYNDIKINIIAIDDIEEYVEEDIQYEENIVRYEFTYENITLEDVKYKLKHNLITINFNSLNNILVEECADLPNIYFYINTNRKYNIFRILEIEIFSILHKYIQKVYYEDAISQISYNGIIYNLDEIMEIKNNKYLKYKTNQTKAYDFEENDYVNIREITKIEDKIILYDEQDVKKSYVYNISTLINMYNNREFFYECIESLETHIIHTNNVDMYYPFILLRFEKDYLIPITYIINILKLKTKHSFYLLKKYVKKSANMRNDKVLSITSRQVINSPIPQEFGYNLDGDIIDAVSSTHCSNSNYDIYHIIPIMPLMKNIRNITLKNKKTSKK